ncbi:MAG: PQQ-dependent sugar dehydrogenase [Fibrobacterota bacterium]|nr:MAG: PQQ-dependent sugar dehydrogenase [Fibrobacterota bacterium]
MRRNTILALVACATSAVWAADTLSFAGHRAVERDLVTGLQVPWGMEEDSAGQIWFTERPGRVSRLDPVTGVRRVLLNLPDVYSTGETGLLDLALHPAFPNVPQIFTVYTYQSGGAIRERLIRLDWEAARDTLLRADTLLDGVRGVSTHVGSRLLFLPDTTLLMSSGDFQNQPIAQDPRAVEGKILRLTTTGAVPSDNPISGYLTWTTGHRNVQGLALGPAGRIFYSEHGPNNDDEFGIVRKGRNYGWPTVHGFCDDVVEDKFCLDSSVVEPLSAYTPTLAVAGIEWYGADAFPSLKGRVLMTSLKAGQLRALRVHASKDSLLSDSILVNNRWGRLRDVLVLANGNIVVAVSNRDGRGTAGAVDDRLILLSPVGTTNVLRKAPAKTAGRALNVRSLTGRLVRSVGDLGGLPSGLHLLELESGVVVPAIQHGGLRTN